MHGGDAAVEAVDLETGEVWIQLGGACSGCGISPMTVQAIQHRLVQAVPEVEVVHADAGFGATTGGLVGSAGGRTPSLRPRSEPRAAGQRAGQSGASGRPPSDRP